MELKPDPIGLPRHPLVIYLLALTFLSGLANLLGEPTAESVETQLHPDIRLMWNVILTLGATTALAGMFWPGDPRTGLLLKRFGYMALSIAALAYALVLILLVGQGALFVGLIIGGFSVACGYATRQVNQAIRATLP